MHSVLEMVLRVNTEMFKLVPPENAMPIAAGRRKGQRRRGARDRFGYNEKACFDRVKVKVDP